MGHLGVGLMCPWSLPKVLRWRMCEWRWEGTLGGIPRVEVQPTEDDGCERDTKDEGLKDV